MDNESQQSFDLCTWTREWSSPVIFVNQNMVNINDLIRAGKPGSVVRCFGPIKESIMVVDLSSGSYDYIAAMISEQA